MNNSHYDVLSKNICERQNHGSAKWALRVGIMVYVNKQTPIVQKGQICVFCDTYKSRLCEQSQGRFFYAKLFPLDGAH